jgi:hypothetical protein
VDISTDLGEDSRLRGKVNVPGSYSFKSPIVKKKRNVLGS